jgi:hypothetical protein
MPVNKFFVERPSERKLKFVRDVGGYLQPEVLALTVDGDKLDWNRDVYAVGDSAPKLDATDLVECQWDKPSRNLRLADLYRIWQEHGLAIPKEHAAYDRMKTFIEVPSRFPSYRFSRIGNYGNCPVLLEGMLDESGQVVHLREYADRFFDHQAGYPICHRLPAAELVEVNALPGMVLYAGWRNLLVTAGLVRKKTAEQIAALSNPDWSSLPDYYHYERV